MTPEALADLADEIVRTRDGQLVLGRVVTAEEAAALDGSAVPGSRARDVPRALASVPSALMRDVSASALGGPIRARRRRLGDGTSGAPARRLRRDDAAAARRVAVPGCGRGHDARFLARHDYDVTGFDFSPARSAPRRRSRAPRKVDVAFEQPTSSAARRLHARFRRRWEYTCYCATIRAGATSTCRRWRGS